MKLSSCKGVWLFASQSGYINRISTALKLSLVRASTSLDLFFQRLPNYWTQGLHPTRMMDRAKVLSDTYKQPLSDSMSSELALPRLLYNWLLFCACLQNLPWQKLFDEIDGGEWLGNRESSSAEAGGVLTLRSRAECVHMLAAWERLEVVLLLRSFRGRCVLQGCRACPFVLRLLLAYTRNIAALLGFRVTRHLDRLNCLDAFNNLRDRFSFGLLMLFRIKILVVLFYNEITETLEGRSEVIEHILRAEAVSRRVVWGLNWVLNNKHLLLVSVRQNIVWPK